jgi:hypothetical protein
LPNSRLPVGPWNHNHHQSKHIKSQKQKLITVKITKHIRLESDSIDDISSALEGRVFHVTKLAYLDAILTSGEIKPNGDCALPTTFGYLGNGFFRKRNCISVFDYRLDATDEIRNFRKHCWPFQHALDGIAILIFKPDIHSSLIPWTLWKEEKALSEQVVPYVEAGYPGPISVNLIDEVICLTFEEDPNSLAAILRKARHAAR